MEFPKPDMRFFTGEVDVYPLNTEKGVGRALHVLVYKLKPTSQEILRKTVTALHDENMCQRYIGTVFNRKVELPRGQLLVEKSPKEGEGSLTYRYSGICLEAVPAVKVGFMPLFEMAESLMMPGEKGFRGVLVNKYDNRDSVGWHSDRDPEQVEITGVICISVGDGTVSFRRKKNVPGAEHFVLRKDIEVKDGEVYIMFGEEFQQYIEHAYLPLKKNVDGATRTSLTFRRFSKHKAQKRKKNSATQSNKTPADEEAHTAQVAKKARTGSHGHQEDEC